MPTSILVAAAPAAISAGVNFGASKLFGGKNGEAQARLAPGNFSPSGINAGGLSSSFEGGSIGITPSAERLGLVRELAGKFGEQADLIGGLRGRVAPGVSELRAQRLGEIESARSAAIGNLRENLQRRRVLGSSFGQDTISRAESEFAGQRDRVAAESFLQELDMTNQLINQEFETRRSQFQTGLNELNLQADIATKLSAGATAQLGANARLFAELSARESAASGKFFNETFAPVGKAIGSGFGNLFSGGGGWSGGTPLAGSSPIGFGGIGSA